MEKRKKDMRRKLVIANILCVVILAGCILVGTFYKKQGTSINKVNVKAAPANASAKQSLTKLQDKDKDTEEQWKGPFKKSGEGVPVLMYHSIAYEKNNPVRLPEENFRQQMKYLKDNGYTTLTLTDLYDYFTENKAVPEKSVVITLDDGYEDNYTAAYPILKEYGFKATIFVITKVVDKDPAYLTSAQLKEMDQNGIDIESHTVNHDNLPQLSYDKQLETLKDSKAFLEQLLNKKVNFLAYPYGKYNDNTLKAVKEAGYIMAVTTDGRWSYKSDGLLKLERVYISGFFGMDVFQERITNPQYKFIN